MYEYANLREQVFTEEYQQTFLAIRDMAKRLLKDAGAFTMGSVLGASKTSGDTWIQMACVDRLVELGEIRELDPDPRRHGQDRVFVRKEH